MKHMIILHDWGYILEIHYRQKVKYQWNSITSLDFVIISVDIENGEILYKKFIITIHVIYFNYTIYERNHLLIKKINKHFLDVLKIKGSNKFINCAGISLKHTCCINWMFKISLYGLN